VSSSSAAGWSWSDCACAGALPEHALPGPTGAGDRGRVARLAGAAALVGVGALLLAACSGGSPNATTGVTVRPAPPGERPSATYAGPADILATAAPQPDGQLWLLAGGPADKTLQQLNLTTGKVSAVAPETSSAATVTQSTSGLLGVGLAGSDTGALELRNGANGALETTVALGAPVKGLFAGADGNTFYVLNGTLSSSSVTTVDARTDHVGETIPVPLDTVAIAVAPNQQFLYAAERSGQVTVVELSNGSVSSAFPVGGSPRALAINSSGTTLYVLKSAISADNVSVVQVATQEQSAAQPAPLDSVSVQLSLDDRSLYFAVGSPTVGNIQVFPAR